MMFNSRYADEYMKLNKVLWDYRELIDKNNPLLGTKLKDNAPKEIKELNKRYIEIREKMDKEFEEFEKNTPFF